MTFLKNVSKIRALGIYKIGKKVEFLPKLYFLERRVLRGVGRVEKVNNFVYFFCGRGWRVEKVNRFVYFL
jgi:hypothetical protein